jgi:hypothetical protein
MSDIGNVLARNANLRGYLNQLSEMVGREVTEEQLSSLEEVEKLKKTASQLNGYPKKYIKIASEALAQERFTSLVQRLAKANSNPISIWLDATASCGTLYIPGIIEFNFSFRFTAIPEGVVVLLTKDGSDKLLLDFSPDEVEVELQGKAWGNAEY